MQCPFCDEIIKDGALKCRYCKEWLNEAEAVQETEGDHRWTLDCLGKEDQGMIRGLESLPQDEKPYFTKAMEKYFDEEDLEVLRSWSLENQQDYFVSLCVKVHIEQPKALEALISIYGLNH